jgi:serine/threonine-protein kinase RsbW
MGTTGSNRRGRKRATFSITIPSTSAHCRDVQKRILDDVARAGFNSDSFYAIRVALEEALTNAIKHGNRLDAGKKVHVRATVTPQKAEVVIEDEGGGFQRSGVPDPTLDENLQRCSGRGILLIESYMNEVKWTRGGRRLKMVKHNEPDVLPRPRKPYHH